MSYSIAQIKYQKLVEVTNYGNKDFNLIKQYFVSNQERGQKIQFVEKDNRMVIENLSTNQCSDLIKLGGRM